MNRRDLLKSAIFATGAAMLPAKELLASSNTLDINQPDLSGFKKVMVGNIDLYILCDGYIRETDVDGYAPRANVAELKQILKDNFRSDGYIDMGMNVPLIKTKGHLILLDTGMGFFADANTGCLIKSLHKAGFKPKDVTDIFISHAHPDHIGGVVNKDFKSVFKNAKIFISKKEVDFWMQAGIKDFQDSALKNQPDFLNAFIPAVQKILTAIKPQINYYNFEIPLYQDFSFQMAPGHTPGMTLTTIRSGNETLIYVADLIHNDVILFPHTEWGFSGDTDLDIAITTRRSVLHQLAETKTKLLAYHLPFPGLGFVKSKASEFEWVAEAFFTP